MKLPDASIILPVFNEEGTIEESLTTLLHQEYPGRLTFVIADGASTDRTREIIDEIASKDDRIQVIDNANRRQAFGLNLAAGVADGEVLIRADGHTWYAGDYAEVSVRTVVETGGAAGGPMNPVGSTWFSRCVAAAMNNPFAIGPARFHHATSREHVDTVYLGAFRKADFVDIGGFRALPSGTAEDADFYARWRASGRDVIVDPAISTRYHPRSTALDLLRQYFRYGVGKAEMLWINGAFPSARPLAPLVFVLALATACLLGLLAVSWLPLAVLVGVWLGVVSLTSLRSGMLLPGVVLATGIMHLAYGVGTLWGLVRGTRRAQPVHPPIR